MKCPKCKTENPDTQKFCGECGTNITHPDKVEPSFTKTLETQVESLTRGTLFADRYEVIEELGSGGMGKVFRVEDTKAKEEIALKLINPEIATDQKTIDRFRNELTTARKIAHRNVCKMFDLGEDQNRCFITMEYVPGEDLKNFIHRSGQLAVGTAVRIAKQVCEGLEEAHNQGVVHRDLKPNNIMIDREGNARIMDFGIARSFESRGMTGTGVIIGTPEYISPEQAEAIEIDHRSDIYSLGVILYEMVTGKVPFEGDSALSIAVKHKTEEPKDPREFNPQLSENLACLILKCMEKDRNSRYQNTREIRSDLNQIEKSITTSEQDLHKKSPRKRIKRSLFRPYVGAGLIIIAAAIMAVVFISLRGVLKKGAGETEIPTGRIWRHKIVVLPFENLGPPDDQYFADGVTEEITSRLASAHDLGVISRQTAVQYDRTGKIVRRIGEDLGVDYILEGTVRWDRSVEGKSRILVTPQLIRVSDDTNIWSDRYSRIIDDIFSVQSDIAEQVIRQIDVTLLQSFRSSQRSKPTENLEAYDLYLKGLESLGSDQLEPDFRNAITLFEQAVALDPDFTLAYTRLSRSHSAMFHYGYDRTEERVKIALETSRIALELEPNLAEAHMTLGMHYYYCHKDYDKALEEFFIAERMLPNEETVLSYIGYILRRQGHFDESQDKLRRALQLNPVDINLLNNIAWSHMILRNYQEADNYYRRSISLAPDQQMAYQELAFNCVLWRGDLEEAKTLVEKMPQDENSESFWYWIELELLARDYQKALNRIAATSLKTVMDQSNYKPIEQYLGLIYYLNNDPKSSRLNSDLARVRLEEMIRDQPDDSRIHSSLGLVYAKLGRKDDALREGKLGVDLYPISKDALIGPARIQDLAAICTILGLHNEAIDHLEHLLSIPSFISIPLLELHPKWDPLRQHPRFQDLVESGGKG